VRANRECGRRPRAEPTSTTARRKAARGRQRACGARGGAQTRPQNEPTAERRATRVTRQRPDVPRRPDPARDAAGQQDLVMGRTGRKGP
jgi:hypothetical protein